MWNKKRRLGTGVSKLWEDKQSYGKGFHDKLFNEANLDGTGPEGKGPRTGRGKGKCPPEDMEESSYHKNELEQLGEPTQGFYTAQFRNEGKKTKWMNIDPETFNQIKELLISMEEEKDYEDDEYEEEGEDKDYDDEEDMDEGEDIDQMVADMEKAIGKLPINKKKEKTQEIANRINAMNQDRK